MAFNAKDKNDYRIDDAIRVKEVRLIGPKGESLGIMPLFKAKQKAEQLQLNLVEIAPNNKPVVCKIMNYGKFKFEKAKKEKENKKPTLVIKEIKFRPGIEENDIQTKVKHIQKFINSNYRVKVTVMFKGRELNHPELGNNLINKVLDRIENIDTKNQPKLEGKNMTVIIDPSKEYSKQYMQKKNEVIKETIK